MTRRIPGGILVALSIAACNEILDNSPGTAQSLSTHEPTEPSDGAAPKRLELPDASEPRSMTCGPMARLCRGLCTAKSDPDYGCGSSACRACAFDHGRAICEDDRCALGACDPGWADCNGDPSDGCEVDLDRNIDHCGTCAKQCPRLDHVNLQCSAGRCSFPCQEGFDDCNGDLTDGCEAAVATDPNHCGSCGIACAAGATCRDNRCVTTPDGGP